MTYLLFICMYTYRVVYIHYICMYVVFYVLCFMYILNEASYEVHIHKYIHSHTHMYTYVHTYNEVHIRRYIPTRMYHLCHCFGRLRGYIDVLIKARFFLGTSVQGDSVNYQVHVPTLSR